VQWLKHGAALPLDGLREALVVDDVLLTRLRSGTDAERLEAMAKLAGRFNNLWNSVRDLMRPVQDEIKTAQSRLQQLAEDLENLSKGQAPGSFPLFHAIRQKLGSRAEQLGRLIEVKPEAERWWPALELFLGRNRWAVVVDEGADYRAALDILSRTPPGREGESLLNPAETRQLRNGAREGSLFEKLKSRTRSRDITSSTCSAMCAVSRRLKNWRQRRPEERSPRTEFSNKCRFGADSSLLARSNSLSGARAWRGCAPQSRRSKLRCARNSTRSSVSSPT
jgi:hypothetical protein